MRQLKPIFNSLLFKLFLSVFFIIGPLIVVHIVNNYYAVEVIRSQVAQSNKNMLNIYMDQIDRNLEGVGNYIFQITQNNTDLYFLQYNETLDPNDYEEAKIRLFNSITNQSYFYTAIDSIFIYSDAYKDFLFTQKSADNYFERYEARDEIYQLFEKNPEQKTGELSAMLAERWQVMDGGRAWKFYLRKGVLLCRQVRGR